MSDLDRIKDLQAAYICLKDSIAEDLISYSELKHVLQYAGFNPSPMFLNQWWKEEETENICFEEFCRIASELQPVTESDIAKVISNVFITDNDKVSIKDLRSLLSISKRKNVVSDYDIDLLIEEVSVENGFLKVSDISKVICQTIAALKKSSLELLEEKSHNERISSRTYTKHQIVEKKQELVSVEEWNVSSLKGSFFLDKDSVISHQYTLEVSCIGPTLVKIMPIKFESTVTTADPLAYIFRESADGSRSYLGYTNLKNPDGSNYWVDRLKEGKYIIIPYASGCHLKKRDIQSTSSVTEIKLINTDGPVKLTHECMKVLEDIFYQMDLDNNGLLNRQEFNLYNWRTSAEIVQDDEWEVVQSNFDVVNGELTLTGFISLHQLEAEDNGGDSEDLWLSLETIGYNRFGQQDQASPYMIEVYCQTSKPVLLVSGLKSGGFLLEKALVRSVMEETEPLAICSRTNVIKYQLLGNQRGVIVIQNKSNDKIRVAVDCSKSVNCVSNRPNLNWEVEIDRKSAIVAHHLIPEILFQPWEVKSFEHIVK